MPHIAWLGVTKVSNRSVLGCLSFLLSRHCTLDYVILFRLLGHGLKCVTWCQHGFFCIMALLFSSLFRASNSFCGLWWRSPRGTKEQEVTNISTVKGGKGPSLPRAEPIGIEGSTWKGVGDRIKNDTMLTNMGWLLETEWPLLSDSGMLNVRIPS